MILFDKEVVSYHTVTLPVSHSFTGQLACLLFSRWPPVNWTALACNHISQNDLTQLQHTQMCEETHRMTEWCVKTRTYRCVFEDKLRTMRWHLLFPKSHVGLCDLVRRGGAHRQTHTGHNYTSLLHIVCVSDRMLCAELSQGHRVQLQIWRIKNNSCFLTVLRLY